MISNIYLPSQIVNFSKTVVLRLWLRVLGRAGAAKPEETYSELLAEDHPMIGSAQQLPECNICLSS